MAELDLPDLDAQVRDEQLLRLTEQGLTGAVGASAAALGAVFALWGHVDRVVLLGWVSAVLLLRALPLEDIAHRLRPFVERAGLDPDLRGKDWYLQAVAAVRGGLTTLAEIGPHLRMFYSEGYEIAPDAKEVLATAEAKQVVQAFKAELEQCTDPNEAWLGEAQNAVKTATGAKGKGLFFPLRACVTGKLKGPELKIVLPLLGKEETLRRIEASLAL